MAIKVKQARDLSTNEVIYFKGHAQATYLSDGTTVEDAINNIEIPSLDEYVTETELSQKGFLVGEETLEELDDVETNTYVKYVAQTLTDEQKNQVRENLGIPSVDYIISLFEELKTLINNNSASDAIAVLDKAILDMHKLQ